MLARARLGQRQEAFAARLCPSQYPSTRQIMAGGLRSQALLVAVPKHLPDHGRTSTTGHQA